MSYPENLIRVFHFCKICKRRFEVTDGLGICCSDECWKEYDEKYADQFSDTDI